MTEVSLPLNPDAQSAKSLGIFYTDIQIADFLVWWAIRSANDTVMDPSFGGGVFIRSACNRLRKLGGNPANQVFGVELDRRVHNLISNKLRDEFGINGEHLRSMDFFDLEPTEKVNCVVGNPPFIRFHRFTSDVRRRALSSAAAQGVRLTQLSSSWAPFLVHSVAMLATDGRLAMVIPMEIAHASYALPLLRYLQSSFSAVTFITFRKKLFPSLSEDTLLLLAEGKGSRFRSFVHRDLPNAGSLLELQSCRSRRIIGTQRLNASALASNDERLVEYFLPRKSRELYVELKGSELSLRLGELVDIGIGYVTGANNFFHLSPTDAELRRIPRQFLKAAVRRGRALSGLRFTRADWLSAVKTGEAGYLLSIPKEADLTSSVKEYLEYGQSRQIQKGYKCRVRSPWYSVPHVYKPDAFLSYMSGSVPLLVANDAQVVAPNSLHVLRIHPHTRFSAKGIATLWQTSLTRLSVEIQGHSLGGGMLKIEPSEAEICVVPAANVSDAMLDELGDELDMLIRAGNTSVAQQKVDDWILRDNLGLSRLDCSRLRESAATLMNRRIGRASVA